VAAVREAAEAANRASLASELRVAQEIQRGMVPKDFKGLSRGLPVDVHALLEPAKEVGVTAIYLVMPVGRVSFSHALAGARPRQSRGSSCGARSPGTSPRCRW